MYFYNILLTLTLLALPFSGISQQVIWGHQPFSEKNIPNLRYSQDTVSFSSSSSIWGIVNLPNAQENPSITLRIKNNSNNQNTASFNLKPLRPTDLKWNNVIQKYFRALLQNKNWYYFELTPNPMVVDAYAGVQFLEVIQQAKKSSKNILLTYQVLDGKEENTCMLDFGKGEGVFLPLWEKLNRYQKILATKKEKEEAQQYLVTQCKPHGFDQIEQWANQKTGLKSDLENSDLNIFQAVENIKIITESIPDSIATHLKRELRELLLSDVALLEMPTGNTKSQKIKQKMDLLKELSLYPELEPILAQYNQLNGKAAVIKEKEKDQTVEFKKVSELYQPYKLIYEKHQQLQVQLDALKMQLMKFD